MELRDQFKYLFIIVEIEGIFSVVACNPPNLGYQYFGYTYLEFIWRIINSWEKKLLWISFVQNMFFWLFLSFDCVQISSMYALPNHLFVKLFNLCFPVLYLLSLFPVLFSRLFLRHIA